MIAFLFNLICTMAYNREVHICWCFCQIIDSKSRKTFFMILSHDQSERKNTWLSTIYIKMVTKTTNHWWLILINMFGIALIYMQKPNLGYKIYNNLATMYNYFNIFSFATFFNVSLKTKWVIRIWTWVNLNSTFHTSEHLKKVMA